MTSSISIGIQGDIGSNNHRVAHLFAEKHRWSDYRVVPLFSTKNVLSAIESGEVNFGTFAWESASGGVVDETQKAVKDFSYIKVDEVVIDIQHALLIRKGSSVHHQFTIHIFSHPQALEEHGSYLKKVFSRFEIYPTLDTASAAKHVASDRCPDNSVAISPPLCAEIYNLDIFENDVPYDSDAWTRFYLVQRDYGVAI